MRVSYEYGEGCSCSGLFTGYLGNYWSDYSGIDPDGDGIGDTAATFTGGHDDHPLIDDCILLWLVHFVPFKVALELTPGSPIGGVPSTEITFTVTVRNDGKIPLDVALHDALPEGLDYVSDSSGITPALAGNDCSWNLGMIDPEVSKSFFLVTRINGKAFGIQENSIAATATLLEGYDASSTANIRVTAHVAANAGPDQAVCPDGKTQIGGEAAEDGFSYSWTPIDFLDNPALAQPTASPTGTTTYKLTKTHIATGLFATDEVVITVNANPSASISPDPATVCAGLGLQLQGNPSGGSGTYTSHEWTGTGAAYLSATDVADPVFSAPAAGSYDLTYSVTDSNGCKGIDAITVTVNANPVASASSNSPVCIGGTIALLGGPDGMSFYLWTGPNGFSSDLPSPSISGATASMAGTYTLRVESSDGCSNEAPTEVIVSSPPLTPSQPSGPSYARRGSSYSYTTSTTDPNSDQVKYTFDWGDGTTDDTGYVASGTPVSRSHVWSRTGLFGVRAKASDDKGCDSGRSSSKQVRVYFRSPGNQSQDEAEPANGSEVQGLNSIEDQAETPLGPESSDMSPPESTRAKPIAVYPG